MEYYQYCLLTPLLFIGALSFSMVKDYIQISYIHDKEKNKLN